MVRIQSVLGPIDSSDLGFTLSHEHVVVSSAGIPHIYPEFIRREESITEGIKQLREAKNEGLSSIIDVSTIDLGRDIRLIEQVSRHGGIFLGRSGTPLQTVSLNCINEKSRLG